MTTLPNEIEPTQQPVTLPHGQQITENGPIVIVGPNGSGKTRRSREITSTSQPEIISALRNTRLSPQLQPMTLQDARNNFMNQRNSARSQPYEITNDFDVMLTALIGDALGSSLEFLRQSRNEEKPELPPLADLEKIQSLWGRLFPGRELRFVEYAPMVVNTVAIGDEPQQYSAWAMSDGEKAALYLAGRVLSADQGAVIVVDEPETHFHSLLATRFWDALERERPDVRFIYATHDMTFAASRSAVQYLLANPREGLTPISLGDDSADLAAVLLGTASLSFYASKVVFCEGDEDALDSQLYSAWFNSNDVVVRPVGSCDMVFRSVSALQNSQLVTNLDVHGIIDRDFHSEDRLTTLPTGVEPLAVHEIETLYVLPDVVGAVARHLSVDSFDLDAYKVAMKDRFSDSDRHRVILERWKVRLERELMKIVGGVSVKDESVESIATSLTDRFDQTKWLNTPETILNEEKATVEGLFSSSSDLEKILRVMPGKQLKPLAATALGIKESTYNNLVLNALRGEDPRLDELGAELRTALAPYLPTL